uniref:Uncharacterized protein n=1 Tax=Avena sativa TaxID=4498 RepID=A0ACD5VZV8_AVESA
MADDGSGAVEAEPAEWYRCMYTCAVGFLFVTFIVLCLCTLEISPLGVVGGVLLTLESILAYWFAAVFMILVYEWWYQGDPEGGQRLVDALIQSDRGFFRESLYLFLRRVDLLQEDV